jgi:methionyl-tRNA formyltransferase
MKYRLAIAGSTQHTVQMAQALAADDIFEIVWTLSPVPKLIGRKQILTKNPLQIWSETQNCKTLLVQKKIDSQLADLTKQAGEIDLLLVVDFGYLIPKWLLDLPKISPLNIHPSALPKWRGSSPGQFCLLFQGLDSSDFNSGSETAITLMIMNQALDEGAIIAQLPFNVEQNWTQNEYYDYAFALMGNKLAELISDFAQGKIKAQEQAAQSPTMLARRLNKADGFVAWTKLQKLKSTSMERIENEEEEETLLQNLLADLKICPNKASQIKLLQNAARAFHPWPSLWTLIPTKQGEKRMKIISCHINSSQLILDQVQIEGKNACLFNECKNSLI